MRGLLHVCSSNKTRVLQFKKVISVDDPDSGESFLKQSNSLKIHGASSTLFPHTMVTDAGTSLSEQFVSHGERKVRMKKLLAFKLKGPQSLDTGKVKVCFLPTASSGTNSTHPLT